MQAVIFAGGKGTRLRPLTYKVPKPMVLINNKPFLWYQLQLLKSNNIKNVLILVSYLGNQIEDYFGDGSNFDLEIVYSYEKKPLGTGGALKNAGGKLNSEFLILNGDTYLPIDYQKLIDYFYQHKKIGVLAVYNNPDKIASNNTKIDKFNLVVSYDKENSVNMNCIEAGAMVFKKEIADFIEKDKIVSLEEEIYPRLIAMKELIAYPVVQRFYDMGSLRGLKNIAKVLT